MMCKVSALQGDSDEDGPLVDVSGAGSITPGA